MTKTAAEKILYEVNQLTHDLMNEVSKTESGQKELKNASRRLAMKNPNWSERYNHAFGKLESALRTINIARNKNPIIENPVEKVE